MLLLHRICADEQERGQRAGKFDASADEIGETQAGQGCLRIGVALVDRIDRPKNRDAKCCADHTHCIDDTRGRAGSRGWHTRHSHAIDLSLIHI